MPTACIQQPGAKVSLQSERLIIRIPAEEGERSATETRREIPLRDLERMVMGERVSLTTPALAEILRRRVPVSIISGRGEFLGSFQPAAPSHGAARLRHYQRTLDPAFTLAIATRIITAKIYNERRLLQRVSANRRAENHPLPSHIPTNISRIERSMRAAAHADTLDSLRGHEGISAAQFFFAWAALLPADFPFERRSTRPPLNPVNATLSFIATLIYHELHSLIHAHGLDPVREKGPVP